MAEESKYPHFTVTSLTAAVKGALERGWSRIIVEGEISGWRPAASGHRYFTLKDAEAQISAVMFSSAFQRCAVRDELKDGAKVALYCSLTVYPPRGNYQLNVHSARLAGVGELMQRYLALKAKLEQEGLFDPAKKRPLPFLPRRIGLVTSEAGAVVHDMCTVLTRRFPALEIRLFPCLVQGADAPPRIVAGLEYFNSCPDWRADLVIVARGGGSFEDLFCFNDESLVRAVAASKIPVVSAVGHETDFTLCDFAADKRAGTPSIAAEIAVPEMAELLDRVSALNAKLAHALQGRGDVTAQRLDHLGDSLAAALAAALAKAERRLERAMPRLDAAKSLALQSAAARLEKAQAKLEAYSPYGVLERGYAIVTGPDGAAVRDAAALKRGDEIRTRFARGEAVSVVSATAKGEK